MARSLRASILVLLMLAGMTACSGPVQNETTTKAPIAPSASLPSAAAPKAKPADAEIAALVALAQNGPTRAQFPQADAVLALDQDDITLQKDGTMVEHHHSIVRILDAQRGKARFADVQIPYDTKRQTLTLVLARTVNDDGSVRVASGDELSEIVPPQLEGATVYSTVRERVVSFPAVDKGSVVELEYVRTTGPTADAALGGEAQLADWDPISTRIVEVTVPEGTSPKIVVAGMALAPPEKSDAASGAHTYRYSETNVPDRQPEPGAPPEAAVLPRLIYSFVPDWRQVAARIADRYLGVALPKSPSARVKSEADRIVGEAHATTGAAKAEALYEFVAQHIRSIELPLGWAGFEPSPPETILDNRYGDDRDKVALYLALCAAEGIAGRPVLVRTQGVPVVEGSPTVAQFDRMIAMIGTGADAAWVDPSDENGQYGLAFAGQENFVLTLEPGGGALSRRPLMDPKSSESAVGERLVVDDKGDLQATYSYRESGWYADQTALSLRSLKGENLAQFFETAAATLSAAALDAGHTVGDLESVSGPIAITQKVSAPGYAPAQGKFRVFELPPPTLDFVESIPPVGLTTRKLPLWIGTPRTIEESVDLTVPAGWKVAYVPPDLHGMAGGLAYDTTCTTKGTAIKCKTTLALAVIEVPPSQYRDFHDALAKMDDYSQRFILLTR